MYFEQSATQTVLEIRLCKAERDVYLWRIRILSEDHFTQLTAKVRLERFVQADRMRQI